MRRVLGLLLGMVVGAGTLGLLEARAQTEDDEVSHTVTAEASRYQSVTLDPLPAFTSGPGASRTVTTTYSVVTNVPEPQRLVASVDGPTPKGVAVWIELEPPDGASAAADGPVPVVGPDADRGPTALVTGVDQVSATDLTVRYTTEATVEADPGDKQIRLEFELVD